MAAQQCKKEQNYNVESGSDESPESKQCEINSQSYEIPLNFANVLLEKDIK